MFEIYDPRWGWHQEPLFFDAYDPGRGVIKGWGRHHRHEDRYALLFGEMELGATTPARTRPRSAREQGRAVRASPPDRQRPAGVWHADRNIGARDVVVVNFPMIAYDHAAPDKERLPLDTPLIPHAFDDPAGW